MGRDDRPAKMRILLVEDDPGHIGLVRRGFGARGGYDVTVVNSLLDAHEILKRQVFDLVICELLLPDGRGTELLTGPLNVGSRDDPPIPFLLLAAQGNEQMALEAIQTGALDYVVKSKSALLGLPRFADRALRQWRQIVARMRAERSLRDSETRFCHLVETTTEGVWMTDREYKTTLVNQRMSDLLGYKPGDLLGQSLLDFIDDANCRDVVDGLPQRRRDMPCQFKMRLRHREGFAVDLLGSWVAISDAEGTFTGVLGMFTDITKQSQVEQRTEELLAQLAHANRLSSMGEMASALAHEMNQPLGTVANYAGTCVDLIAENRLDMSDLKRSLEKINEQCLRAGKIIGQLKRFASKVPKRMTIDVNQIACEVRQLMISDTGRRVEIQLELNRDVPKTLGDPIQLQQVLVDLIRHAIDSASVNQSDTRIVISTTVDDTEVTLCVSDRGTGHPSKIEQVLEPPVAETTDGWEMELSISRAIIRAHDGRLWATNNAYGGTTVHVSLPIRSESEDAVR